MQFLAQLTVFLVALLQLAYAQERVTYTSTRTIQKYETHTYTAPTPIYTPSTYSTSSSYTTNSTTCTTSTSYTSPIYNSPTYTPPTYTPSTIITYQPSGYPTKPTVVPTYSQPTLTPTALPTGAAGRVETGMSVVAAALVAGFVALTL